MGLLVQTLLSCEFCPLALQSKRLCQVVAGPGCASLSTALPTSTLWLVGISQVSDGKHPGEWSLRAS